jgi:hypothetical protein
MPSPRSPVTNTDSTPSHRGVALRRTSRSHAAPHPYDSDDDAPEPSRLRCECRDHGEQELELLEPEASAMERLKEWESSDG